MSQNKDQLNEAIDQIQAAADKCGIELNFGMQEETSKSSFNMSMNKKDKAVCWLSLKINIKEKIGCKFSVNTK